MALRSRKTVPVDEIIEPEAIFQGFRKISQVQVPQFERI
jgi:hypothetical protein